MNDPAARTRALLWITVAYLAALVAALVTGIVLRDRHPIEIALAADVAATVVVFGFSYVFDNSSFYDLYWSEIPPVIALYFVAAAEPDAVLARQVLVVVLVTLWAARLSLNWLRGWEGLEHEDWRYVDLRASQGRMYWIASFFGLHFVPTLVVFLGCLPLWLALGAGGRALGWLDAIGVACTLGGTALEYFADEQLRRFKLSSPPPGSTFEGGLWAWSRHPNYAGEILFWIGLAFFGLAADGFVWWAWTGAVAMVALFRFASLPMMEKRMLARRPGYEERQRRVSLIVPWPPKARS
jgi:steroid 5-alpha reductase family enzyme